VIIALSINNTGDTTGVLITFSEPFSFVLVGEQNKVLRKKSSISCARNRRIGARARFAICGRSSNIKGAFIVVIAKRKISAESVFV